MKFVGRETEMQALKRLSGKDGFQMAVVYGRRRIGKTALISQFCKEYRTLWFTAREQNKTTTLRDFSRTVYDFFSEPVNPLGFPSWDFAFQYIADKAAQAPQDRFVFVFDEFPYAAEAEPSLPSTLQIAIDHMFKGTQMLLILCGGNERFMEHKVLGYKSPLFGRRTAQIHLKPFNIFEARQLMPDNASWIDIVHYYSTLGGTPYYLEQIDHNGSFEENIEQLCFNMSGILYEEPLMLMRQELREPVLYNSILETIGAGKNRSKDIAEKNGIPSTSISPYLQTLESLGLIERNVPFGEEKTRSHKGLWKIKDPFFAYWYQFVSPYTGIIDMGNGHAPAVNGTSGGVFETYVGQQFEEICMQWLFRECRENRLDFMPDAYGKWWGSDPKAKQQADIDVVMTDRIHHKVILGECKWRESFDETEAIQKLYGRAYLIKAEGEKAFYLFTKNPANPKLGKPLDLTVVDAETMLD